MPRIEGKLHFDVVLLSAEDDADGRAVIRGAFGFVEEVEVLPQQFSHNLREFFWNSLFQRIEAGLRPNLRQFCDSLSQN